MNRFIERYGDIIDNGVKFTMDVGNKNKTNLKKAIKLLNKLHKCLSTGVSLTNKQCMAISKQISEIEK